MKVNANGLQFEVDLQGPEQGPVVMLVMGLGMQLTAWPQSLVDDLVARGFRVLRLDNRDIGLSTWLDEVGTPSMLWNLVRWMLRLRVRAAYTVRDMAADAIGVLDALGIERAHVCGASMGGMIAQRMALHWPQRVASATLIMTSPGGRHLPRATREAQAALLSRPKAKGFDALVDHGQHVFTVIGSPGYRPEPQAFRERIAASLRRSFHPAGTMRQLAAIIADGDRGPGLPGLRLPVHVIHGEADPLIPVAHGRELQRLIPGATLDVVPGMGHDFPEPLMARFAQGIAQVAGR